MTPPTGSRPPLPAEIARYRRAGELGSLAQPVLPRMEAGTVSGIPAIPQGALELAGLGQQPGIGQPQTPIVPPYFRGEPALTSGQTTPATPPMEGGQPSGRSAWSALACYANTAGIAAAATLGTGLLYPEIASAAQTAPVESHGISGVFIVFGGLTVAGIFSRLARLLLGGTESQTEVPRRTPNPYREAFPTPQSQVPAQPAISSEHVARMREALVPATSINGAIFPIWSPLSHYIHSSQGEGGIYLDDYGNVVGANFLQPSGILRGLAVHTVATEGGTILHMDIPTAANAMQRAALLALQNSPRNVEARVAFLRRHPYAVDVALIRGVGPLLEGLDWVLGNSRINNHRYEGRMVLIWSDSGHLRFLRSNMTEQPPLAVLDVRLDSGETFGGPMTFTYQVVQGHLPLEVIGLLEHVRARAAAGIPGFAESGSL